MKLDAFFTPAEFEALSRRKLDQAVCVVFDVLRATSTMVTALANGATSVVPVGSIEEALAVRQKEPAVLLGGERNGFKIRAEAANGVAFDLGNSPREYTAEKVRGRTIVTTTTNGTRALRSCAGARAVLLGTFLNLKATTRWLLESEPSELLVVGSGTFEEAAYEDALGAGALCKSLSPLIGPEDSSDSALMARKLYELVERDLAGGIAEARNARKLLGRDGLRDDVAFCVQRDIYDFVAGMDVNGRVVRVQEAAATYSQARPK